MMSAVQRSLFNSPPASSETKTKESKEAVKTSTESAPTSSRGDRFYSSEQATTISEDLLAFTTKAFSRALTKEEWKELTTSYPQIKDTESFLVAPSMEAGMKEEIKKCHGYTKTKELFAFNDGLVERQSAFLVVARPLLAALTALMYIEARRVRVKMWTLVLLRSYWRMLLYFLGMPTSG